jgi:hypothetical protein
VVSYSGFESGFIGVESIEPVAIFNDFSILGAIRDLRVEPLDRSTVESARCVRLLGSIGAIPVGKGRIEGSGALGVLLGFSTGVVTYTSTPLLSGKD